MQAGGGVGRAVDRVGAHPTQTLLVALAVLSFAHLWHHFGLHTSDGQRALKERETCFGSNMKGRGRLAAKMGLVWRSFSALERRFAA